tara:strand:- start:25649 stop:25867 length:219 start_codon:yes stop_codon:yes gene_type:complete
MRQQITELQSDMTISLYHRLNRLGNEAVRESLKNATVRKNIIKEAIAELKKDFPLATDNDIQAAINQIGANV